MRALIRRAVLADAGWMAERGLDCLLPHGPLVTPDPVCVQARAREAICDPLSLVLIGGEFEGLIWARLEPVWYAPDHRIGVGEWLWCKMPRLMPVMLGAAEGWARLNGASGFVFHGGVSPARIRLHQRSHGYEPKQVLFSKGA